MFDLPCPICGFRIAGSEYLHSVFPFEPYAEWAACAVTHHRHQHIRYYDRSWQNYHYGAKSQYSKMTHEEFKAMVNNRGKRQLIRALDKSKTPKQDKIGLFLGFSRLQANDNDTDRLIYRMSLKYGFTIKEENPRLRPVPLPYLGDDGVCALCGKDLPPRRRKWCSDDCAINYDRQRGFSYRWAALEANRKKHGHLACDKCSNPIEFESDAVADHIKPLYQGGDHSVANLQILCPVCNREKTTLDLKGVIQRTAKAKSEAHRTKIKTLDEF